VKTVQRLLCHSYDSTTLAIYAHSMSEDRLAAQGDMLKAMMKPPSDAVNWAATGESGVKSRTSTFRQTIAATSTEHLREPSEWALFP